MFSWCFYFFPFPSKVSPGFSSLRVCEVSLDSDVLKFPRLPRQKRVSLRRFAREAQQSVPAAVVPGLNGTRCENYPACRAVGLEGHCCPNRESLD